MGSLARFCVLCSLIGLLHIVRYLVEMLYYHHCSSTIYALLFTSGSSTCVALRSVSTNMTTSMATFAGVILNTMLRSLSDVSALDFSILGGIDTMRGLMGRQSTSIRNANDAPHM